MVALESQLNASVRMQIENTREGIQRLANSQDRLRGITESINKTMDLCQASQSLLANYPTIKQVSSTVKNFRLVNGVYDQFTALDETVARTDALLQQDKEAGRSDNLLLVFYHLSRLEAFRSQTLGLMKDSTVTTMYTLQRYFKKLDDLSADFEDFFWRLPKQFVQLAAEGQQVVLVRVLKVLSRMDRGVRARFMTILDEGVTTRFASTEIPQDDIEGALQAISFWLSDLTAIRSDLAPCFPPDMNIMDFYILTYHRHVHGILGRCINLEGKKKHDTGDVLVILSWVKEYYGQVLNDLGYAPEDLEPCLLDDRDESKLIGEYMEASRGLIAEWIANMFEGEKKTFLERKEEPDTDASGFYFTAAVVDLLGIIKQNLNSAALSGKGKLVLEIINELCKAVADFQKRMSALLEGETAAFLGEKNPANIIPLFEDYVIAVGNTGLMLATNLQAEVIEVLDDLITPEYVAAATKQLKAMADGFVGISKLASACLCRIIFSSVAPAIAQLFTHPDWYGGSICSTILVTFGDFLTDYHVHCEEFLFNKLAADVMEAFILAYLRQMRAKSTKLKLQTCLEYFNADLDEMGQYFGTLRDPKRVHKVVDGVDKFIQMVTAGQKMVYIEFFAFWKSYPDVPMGFLEEVLAKRDDMDKATLKEIMETCRQKMLEEKPSDIPPSIFSKV